MRGLRSFIILLVIAIPLAWFTYRESKREPADEGSKRDKVFTVDSEKIEEIAITSESGDETRLQKSGSDWQIVAPMKAQPDATEVSGIATNLSTLEMQRVVDENPPDLKEYGLAEPRIRVSFKAGGEEHTLLIGQKTPPGTDLYAKRADDNKVFLIASYLESTFDKGTFDLRDKSVLKVDRDKLDAVEFTAAGSTTRFVRPSGGEWQIAAPVQARADFSAIESLVSRLANLRMRSVIDAPAAADEKKFGFEKPAATVRLGSGSSQATLVIGGSAGDDAVYAKDASRPAVYTIESSLLDELKKDPSDFRQKDLFEARSFNATHVEIARGGQTHRYEKTKAKNKEGQDEEQWRETSPQAREIDQSKFNSLLMAITSLRASGFVEGAAAAKALSNPELTVAVKFDEGKKEDRVTLGKSGSDGYAARPGEPGAAKIEASEIDSIIKTLEELK